MQQPDRRAFIRLLGSGAFAAAMQQSIGRAAALPANHRTGTIEDVEHIVVLMQENRSFDHYFGTLQGVRGFNDPRAVTLPSGKPVWYQADGGGHVLPFRPTEPNLGLVFLQDLAHDWQTTHNAWNHGNWDQWVPNKGTTTMAHLSRADIPFHYALADAFTICDAYHASLMGPTDPNRFYMWTGWVGNDGKGGGPVVDNAEAGYGWTTYPERLQEAGISWKIYQDVGLGLTEAGHWGETQDPHIGTYGDNALLYFRQYRTAAPDSPLAKSARTGTNIAVSGTLFDPFRDDVRSGTLPHVSWIVAPEAYSEHPNWPPNYGAWFIAQVLDILTSKPEVWAKTALFVTYDENDGFFDHMVPPTPPRDAAGGASTVSTEHELFPGNAQNQAGPYGLGVRVPMLVVSPWSKGGVVNSQLFDHTSIIRFIEQRFGPHHPALVESNITPWRRAVCGDLTSAFDFRKPNTARSPLPSVAAYAPKDALRHPDYKPVPPSRQALATQEQGVRRARALPYRMKVTGLADHQDAGFAIQFGNPGSAALVYQVRSADTGQLPRSYTVEPGRQLSGRWAASVDGQYDLSVSGPNGYLRGFRGTIGTARIEAYAIEDHAAEAITLVVTNRGASVEPTRIVNHYTNETRIQPIAPGQSQHLALALAAWSGWYDLSVSLANDPAFARRLAGHVETGRDSTTDPMMGAASGAIT